MQCHVSHFFEILLIPKRICWLFNHSDMPKFEAREARFFAAVLFDNELYNRLGSTLLHAREAGNVYSRVDPCGRPGAG